MSLDKAIKYGKEHRKPYRGSKSIDKTCRNHGGCDYCKSNRLHKHKRRMKPIYLEDFNINSWFILKSIL